MKNLVNLLFLINPTLFFWFSLFPEWCTMNSLWLRCPLPSITFQICKVWLSCSKASPFQPSWASLHTLSEHSKFQSSGSFLLGGYWSLPVCLHLSHTSANVIHGWSVTLHKPCWGERPPCHTHPLFLCSLLCTFKPKVLVIKHYILISFVDSCHCHVLMRQFIGRKGLKSFHSRDAFH